MRVDGFSSHSYPIKRKPRKGLAHIDDDSVIEGVAGEVESEQPVQHQANSRSQAVATLPARAQQQDPFQRTMSTHVAEALASYMTTASFVEWDGEVLGLDVHI
ncbi:hypothetical protein [Pseudomonas typographi]|uniref:Uncharacterized protein n=1 Tax=Pseudomonas typographi TaxID=2715964 RepID=A0ABR7Z7J7_9PSED|nr:hypothetical protein [Pseudomonas typographi]MBD1553700.1 hypothetical protein [Pseudomonas typographi]MBD1589060.1 hypothetical protein [Pseudomonas typographi]MBD1601425.1 hypothetical protein [Pseudomonas typographi]